MSRAGPIGTKVSVKDTNPTVLWVANITENIAKEELILIFEKYGPVHRIQMNGPFCTIEFENSGDARKARSGLDSVDIKGRRLSIDWYRGHTGTLPLQGLNWWGGRPGKHRADHHKRVHILNLPKGTSKEQLLALAWEAGGSVVYLDVLQSELGDNALRGIVEYSHSRDASFARELLDGREFKGRRLRFIAHSEFQRVLQHCQRRRRDDGCTSVASRGTSSHKSSGEGRSSGKGSTIHASRSDSDRHATHGRMRRVVGTHY